MLHVIIVNNLYNQLHASNIYIFTKSMVTQTLNSTVNVVIYCSTCSQVFLQSKIQVEFVMSHTNSDIGYKCNSGNLI